MRRQDTVGQWPALSPLTNLPADLRDEFLQLGTPRVYNRGRVLMSEHDETPEVHLVLSGFVRVLNHTFTGDQVMIAIRTRGDLIGELSALDGKPRISTVIAASRTTARLIDDRYLSDVTN